MSGINFIYGRDGNGDPVALEADQYFQGLVTIDTVHERIHRGQSFLGGHLWPVASAIADNANADLLIVTGSTPIHMISHISAGGQSEVYYYEGVTVSANGTAADLINKNRLSSVSSGCAIYYGPTVTGTGTQLPSTLLAAGVGNNLGGQAPAGGFDGSFDSEIILKASTKYLIRVTNRAGAAIPIAVNVSFYANVS